MALYTYEVDQFNKSAWHKVLLSFTDASIDQTSSYAEARWHKASISHLVVKRNDTIIAAAQVIIRRVPFLRSGVAHVKFGPLWRPIDQPTNPEHLQQILHSCVRSTSLNVVYC